LEAKDDATALANNDAASDSLPALFQPPATHGHQLQMSGQSQVRLAEDQHPVQALA
jgi:hypothetical protein